MSNPRLPRSDSKPPLVPGEPSWNKDIKAYYDAAAAEPIPADFEKLMAELAKAIKK